MTEQNEFLDLVRRVRQGDPDAASELVRRYEPHILRMANIKLRDPRLRRAVSTSDIGQMVLKSFFFRAALGEYELHSPDDLLKLLARMVRNKVTDRYRQEKADCRDHRRQTAEIAIDETVSSADPTPSAIVSERELQAEALRRFSPEERAVFHLKQQGLPWIEIAEQTGGTPEGCRKQLARAIARIAEELGIDEV